MVAMRRPVEDGILASQDDWAFAMRDHRDCQFCKDSEFKRLGQYTSLWLGPEGLCIKRVKDKSIGFIVNVSAQPMKITYSPLDHSETFGPVTDFILPMQAKEIGAAPGKVLWRIQWASS